MSIWESLSDSYINVLKQRGLSPSYISNVENELIDLGTYFRQIRPKTSIENINSSHLLKYIERKTPFKSKATIAGTISRVRCFGEFLVGQNVWMSNPLRWIQGPKLNNHRAISKSLNREHIARMYVECFKQPSTYSKFLNPAIFSILYTTGIRKGELLALNLDSWDSKEQAIKVYSSKTDSERFVPVQDITAKLIEAYLTKRTQIIIKNNIQNQNALFVATNGQRINGNTLHSKFKKIADKAEVSFFSLHMLRHSCATDLIEAGVGIPYVQRVLGHACLQTTMRYTHVSDPQRKEAIRIHPINQILGEIHGE